jgi:hypothetical protein
MVEVTTPRGSLKVSDRQAADARDRLFRLPAHRRTIVGERARALLQRRDSRRAAAIVAALAALAALTAPAIAV